MSTFTKDTSTDMSMFIKQLEVALGTHRIVEVTFTKVDGTIRIMKASRHPEIVPPTPIVEGAEKKERKANDAIVSVYDLEVKNWRSFRKDNVLSYTIKE
jgi:hypothetical protein